MAHLFGQFGQKNLGLEENSSRQAQRIKPRIRMMGEIKSFCEVNS